MNRKEIMSYMRCREDILKDMDLMGPKGQLDIKKNEKLEEIVGFGEIIIRYLNKFPIKKNTLTVLECSCGKSYLGFILSLLLPKACRKKVNLVGVDYNPDLIERCERLSQKLRLAESHFFCRRILDFKPQTDIDLVVSLHACDTATDEALVQGIRCGAGFVHAVPCCQNQIRGQIKDGHPLDMLTQYGPARYRMANLLTDTLRAEFMRAAGYHVEMGEIGSPKLTPKNLCLSARKVRRKYKGRRDIGYRHLKDLFNVKTAIEKMCPEVLEN